MKRILMSIKPEYAYAILYGHKQYEYRKRLWKGISEEDGTRKVFVYASSPIRRIIGDFCVERIISGNKEIIWNTTKEGAGIDRKAFFNYFKSAKTAYAIKIHDVVKYVNPIELADFMGISRSPQSWRYIK